MYVYIVVILTLFAAGAFIFIFAAALESIQEAFNPMLVNSSWSTAEHFSTFELAATFVTNLWLLFPALLVFGLLYWAYTYSQRRAD